MLVFISLYYKWKFKRSKLQKSIIKIIFFKGWPTQPFQSCTSWKHSKLCLGWWKQTSLLRAQVSFSRSAPGNVTVEHPWSEGNILGKIGQEETPGWSIYSSYSYPSPGREFCPHLGGGTPTVWGAFSPFFAFLKHWLSSTLLPHCRYLFVRALTSGKEPSQVILELEKNRTQIVQLPPFTEAGFSDLPGSPWVTQPGQQQQISWF